MVVNVKAKVEAAEAAEEVTVACGGCGKARKGTAAVKDRKREASTAPADRVSTTTGAVNPSNSKYAEYLRTLKQYRQGS